MLTPAASLSLAAVLALASAAPGVPAAVQNAGITTEQWKKLARGEVVSHLEAGREKPPLSRGSGAFIVALPWTKAFDRIGQVENLPEYSSCLKTLQLLMRATHDGQTSIKTRETHQSLWIRAQYTLDYVEDLDAREIRWSLDPKAQNDVAQMTGAWRFIELDAEHTLVTYRLAATSGRALPPVIEDYFTGVMLPTFLNGVRDYVTAEKTKP